MAYVGSTNNAVNLGTADYFNAIKTALLAAGWELMASGSPGGTNPGYSATGTPDRVPDVTSWNQSGAWCRLREPGGAGGREYVFLRGATATSGLIKYSRSTGFIGGTPGTTTAPTTGTGGDGVVWVGTQVGFSATGTATNSYDTAATGTGSAVTLAIASGYVSCVASDTATNGVYGWWMQAWAAGTATMNQILWTEAVQAGTYPANDADPSYRNANPTPFASSGYTVPNLPQYWQAYGLYTTAGVKVSPELYQTSGAPGIIVTVNTAVNFATVTIPRTNIGFGVYGATVQTYPLLIGVYGASGYPKGFSTGFSSINVLLNNADTLNLTGSEPRIVVNGTYGYVMPWVPNIVPLY